MVILSKMMVAQIRMVRRSDIQNIFDAGVNKDFLMDWKTMGEIQSSH